MRFDCSQFAFWEGPYSRMGPPGDVFAARTLSLRIIVDVDDRFAIITAVVGGFYFRTFWLPWSIQVILCQQFNLFFSLALTRGLGLWSAWRRYAMAKYSPTDEQPQPTVRGSTNFPWAEQQGIGSTHDLESMSTNSRLGDGQSATSTTTLFRSARPTDAEQPITDQIVRNKIQRKAADALYGTHFGPAPWSQSQLEAAWKSNLGCVDETSLAIKCTLSPVGPVSEESTADPLPGVRVVGVERRVNDNSDRWLYLTKPDDMTCAKNPTEGLEEYGDIQNTVNLDSGFQYIQFTPKWVEPQQLPPDVRVDVWKVMGPTFWRHTDLADSARWEWAEKRYQNFSTRLTTHLCAREDCKACSQIWGEPAKLTLEHLRNP